MLKVYLRYLFVATIVVTIISGNVMAGITRIWAVDDGEKIKKEDIDNPLAKDLNNAVWKNNTVNIFGAKNEIIAFQLIIQADETGAQNVNVVVSDLKNHRSVIPGSNSGPSDPYDYRGRNVELFTEHYFNIIQRSPPLWFFAKSATPSDYYTGWLPDCLIPFSAPSGKGGAPFSIEGKNNQGVWVDILIPKNAVPGIFKGKVTITVSDKVFATIPILLQVYDFTLPDINHVINMFGYSPQAVARRHGLENNSEAYYQMEAKYYQLAHRHRFDLVRNVENLTDMTRYQKRYLTGELYKSAHGYAGPGENIGNKTFSIGYGGDVPAEYGENINAVTKESWWAGSDAWENWFIQNAPDVERHKYLFPDEPDWKGPKGALGTGSMDTINMQGTWTHTNPGIGRNIPTMASNTIKPVIQGSVDFWTVSSQEAVKNATPEEVAAERAKGHKYGIYNGYRPGMGAVVTDADAIEFRVMPWIVFKYNLDQYFYWSVSSWGRINVFTNPLTYRNQINGDGTFLYPGQDYMFPEDSRNLAGPLSSVRAKNWRRGAQDFEYLWLAKETGLETEMNKILNGCVPTALWDARSQEDISWSSHGYKFDEGRKQLAELISSKTAKKK